MDRNEALGISYLVSQILVDSTSVFIRRSFGREAFGIHAVLTAILLLMLAAGQDGMGLYLIAWFCALIYRRIETFRHLRRGIVQHSLYEGYCFAAMKLPGVKTEFQGRFYEPLICLSASLALLPFSQTAAQLVLASAVGGVLKHGMDMHVTRRRAMQANDAEIEMRNLAEWKKNSKRWF